MAHLSLWVWCATIIFWQWWRWGGTCWFFCPTMCFATQQAYFAWTVTKSCYLGMETQPDTTQNMNMLPGCVNVPWYDKTCPSMWRCTPEHCDGRVFCNFLAMEEFLKININMYMDCDTFVFNGSVPWDMETQPGTWICYQDVSMCPRMTKPIPEHEDGPWDIAMAGCSAPFLLLPMFFLFLDCCFVT